MLIGTKHSGYSRANIRLYFDPVTIMAAGTAEAAAITAAEIAAAEAAAIAAAEVAAAEAAALAAQQAAAATAAEAGAITAAEAGAAQAAQQAGQAGIMQVGGTTAAPGATPLTAEAVQQEIYRQAASANINPGVVTDASSNLATQGQQMLPQRTFDFSSVDKFYNDALSKTAGPEAMSFDSFGNPVPVSSPAYSSADPTGLAQMSLDANAATPPTGPSTFDKLLDYADKNPFKTGAAMYMGASKLGLLDPSKQTFNDDPYDGPLSKYRLSPDFKGSTATPNIYRPTYPTYAEGGSINLQGTFDMGSGQGGSQMGGSNNPQSFVGNNNAPFMMPRVTPMPGLTVMPGGLQEHLKGPMSQGMAFAEGGIMSAAPVQAMSDQNNAMGYQQAMAATGGQVAHFAAGGKTGSLTNSLDYYKQMMSGKSPAAPSERPDVGIFRDPDPDTRTRDALTAALIRNSKVSKGANLSIPSMKRPTPMGQINLAAPGIKRSNKEDVEEAAGGGIMGASNLGDYSDGGRLLRGPGDGISDSIPAMIGKKQPARLADGEFVVPARIVSELGNGSTEAGARKLYAMMDRIQKARNKTVGKGKVAVNSRSAKYLPK